MTITTNEPYRVRPANPAAIFVNEQQLRKAVVCTYMNRVEAQAAVDRLVRSGIQLESIAIEQESLPRLNNPSEQVSPTAGTLWRAAVLGAAIGLLLGMTLGLVSGMTPLGSYVELATNGLLMGILTGLSLGIVFYTLDDSAYDRYWRLGLSSAQYNVVVEPQLVSAVHRMLFPVPPLDMLTDRGQPG